MAITIPGGLKITTQEPVDSKIILTKAQMLDPDDAVLYPILPAIYFCLCSDDKQIYVYDRSNTRDTTLGRFRLYSGGSSSGDKSFTYEQSTLASQWVITHNLNKYPSVTVIDYGNNELEGDVVYDSANQLTITFLNNGAAVGVSGRAYLN